MREPKEKLRQLVEEKENFLKYLQRLNAQVQAGVMSSKERTFLLEIKTKGVPSNIYLEQLNNQIIHTERHDETRAKKIRHASIAAAGVLFLAMFFYAFINPTLTGLVGMGDEQEYVLNVEQNFTNGTTDYYFNIVDVNNNTNNLTSLRITGQYYGQFIMKLVSNTDGIVSEYVIYAPTNSKDSENLITGYAVREKKDKIELNDTTSISEPEINKTVPEVNYTLINTTELNVSIINVSTNETINETINETENGIINETINETQILIENETEIISDFIISFTTIIDECEETCSVELSPYNLSIVVEVLNGSFYLEKILYTQEIVNRPPTQLKTLPDVYGITDINLSEYFSDPDGDDIEYDFMSESKITYSLDGEILTIIPSNSSQEFYIYATDKENVIISNTFTIYSGIKIPQEILDALAKYGSVRIILKTDIDTVLLTSGKGSKDLKITGLEDVGMAHSALLGKKVLVTDENSPIEIKREMGKIKSVIVDSNLLNELSEMNGIEEIIIDTPYSALTNDVLNITKITEVRSAGYSGSGVKICVLDTGLSTDLGFISTGYNFIDNTINYSDNNGHGTNVVYPLISSAPGIDLIIAKVIDDSGIGYASDIVAGLEYCMQQNASIVSMSIGGGESEGYCDEDIVAQKVNELNDAGILVVVATGNDGTTNSVKIPSCASGALPVGASTKTNMIAGFSNFNNATLLVSPGQNIITKDISGNDVSASGTSMSVPFVAGAAALLIENEALSSTELKDLLVHTGDLINYSGSQFAQVNAWNALIKNYTNNLSAREIVITNATIQNYTGLVAGRLNMNLISTYSDFITTCSLQDARGMQYDSRGLFVISSYGDDYITVMNFSNPLNPVCSGSVYDISGAGSIDGIWFGTLVDSEERFYTVSTVGDIISVYNITTGDPVWIAGTSTAISANNATAVPPIGSLDNGYDIVPVNVGDARFVLISAAVDDTISVYNFTNDMTPVSVSYRNTAANPCTTDDIRKLYNIPGTTYVVGASYTDDALSVWSVEVNGSLTCIQNRTDSAGANSLDNVQDFYFENSTKLLYATSPADGYLTIVNMTNLIASGGVMTFVGSVANVADKADAGAAASLGPMGVAIGVIGDSKFAFVGSSNFTFAGIDVINVTNPAAPTLHSEFKQKSESCVYNGTYSLYVIDDYLYATSGSASEGCFYVIKLTVDEDVPNMTHFNGSTTKFMVYNSSTLGNFSGAALEVSSYGRIAWNSPINATNMDFDTHVDIRNGFASVNISGLNPTLNTSANITFYNITASNLKILKNGGPCTTCTFIGYSGSNFSFQVTGFSNYSLTINLTLINPTDGDNTVDPEVKYISNIVDANTIVNATLYTNETGSWAARETRWNGEINYNSTGLVGLWHFNNESGENSTLAKDWIDGLNATPINSNWYPNIGRFGGAHNLTMTNSYIDFSKDIDFMQNFTLSFWAYRTIHSGGSDSLFYKENEFWIAWDSNDNTSFIQQTGPPNDGVYGGAALSNNVWYNYILVHNDTDGWIMYVNGNIYTSGTMTMPGPSGGNMSFGGQDIGYISNQFGGVIDEVAIWNKSLSSTEIAALYNYSRIRFIPVFQNRSYNYSTRITWNVLAYNNLSDYAWSSSNYSFIIESDIQTVDLTNPGNGVTTNNPIMFLSNATDNQEIINATLYTNESGSWAARETRWNGEVALNSTGLQLLVHLNNETVLGENSTFYKDSSPNNYTGVCSGNACPIYNANGKFGSSYNFNFTDGDKINFGSASLNLGANMTVSVWMYPHDNNTGIDRYLVARLRSFFVDSSRSWGGGDHPHFYIYLYNSTGSAQYSTALVSKPPLNEWSNIVAGFNGTHLLMYYNGVLETVDPVGMTGAILINNSLSTNLQIGVDEWDATFFNGSIDEVAIWNRSLSNEEIAALYNYTRANFNPVFQNRTYGYSTTTTWNVLVVDNKSNSAWSSNNYSFYVASQLPVVSLTSPSNSGTDVIPVYFISNVTDNNEVKNATLYTNESGSWTAKETRWNGEVPYNMTGLKILFHFNNETQLGDNGTVFYDFSGNGNNGTCSAGCINKEYVQGPLGYALDSNAVGGSGITVNDGGLYDNVSEFTISVWLKYNNYTLYPQTISRDSYYLRVQTTSGSIRFRLYNATSDFSGFSGFSVSTDLDTWTHLVIVFNGTAVYYFQDGGAKSGIDQVYGGRTHSGTGGFEIYGNGFNGSMDEFAYWNRSLSDEEAQSIYNYTRGEFHPLFQPRNLAVGMYKWNVLSVDNQTNSAWASSNYTFDAQSADPTITNATILPTLVYSTSTLIGYCNGTMGASEPVTYYYTWYKDGVVNSSGSVDATSGVESNVANVSSSLLHKGQSWKIGCRVGYLTSNSTWMNSSSVTVLNTAPVIASSSISPATAYDNSTLLAYCTATDADNDTVIYNYRWFVNSVLNSTGNTSPVIQSVETNIANMSYLTTRRFQTWTLECKADDGSINSTAINTTRTISNYVPAVSSVILSSTSGYNLDSDNITLTFTPTDGDNDTVWNTTDWRKNGTSIALINMPFNKNVSTNTTDAVLDYSSYGNYGTLGTGNQSRMPTWISSGKVGGAYNFSESNWQHIKVNRNGLALNSSFTITAWYKIRNEYNNYLFSIGDYESLYYYQHGTYSYISGSSGFGDVIVNRASIYPSDTWIFVAIVFTDSNTTIYENGTYMNSTPRVNSMSLEDDIYIGGRTDDAGLREDGSAAFFDGVIDEFMIWNRSLSYEQIQALYQAGLNNKSLTTLVSQETTIGNNWTVAVTPTDGYDDGTTVTSNPLAIVSDSISVSLIKPANGNTTITSPVFFITNASDDSSLINATLYTNESGSWAARETRWNGEVGYNSTGLVALWHFNNESAFGENSTLIYDWSGNNNNITSCSGGCPNYSSSGLFGGAFIFNKSSSFTISDSSLSTGFPGKSTGSNVFNLTFSMWIYLNSYDNDFICKGTTSYCFWNPLGGTMQEYVSSTNSVATIDLNTWQHLAMTYNGSTVKIFHNGQVIAQNDAFTSGFPASGDLLYLGQSSPPGDGDPINGTLDEVAIWTRPLSDSEILALYNYSKKSFYPVFQNRTLGVGNYIWNVLAVDNQSQSAWAASNYTFTIINPLQCTNLTSANTVYNLTQDVSISGDTCFRVDASSVTLNCNGHSITGDNTSDTFGVHSDQFNTTIRNCIVRNFGSGVYFVDADNGTIINTNASTTQAYSGANGAGIYLYNNAYYNQIINSTGSSSSGNGVVLYWAYQTILSNSTGISNSGSGIYLTSANYNTLYNFTGISNTGRGIMLYVSSYNNITNSNGTSSAEGIWLESNSNNTITGTIAYGISGSYGAILVYNSDNTKIANSTAYVGGNGIGIAIMVNSDNVQVINTSIINLSSTMTHGIVVSDGANSTFIDCQGKSIIGANTAGSYGVRSYQFNTTIKNCLIRDFSNSIRLTGSSYSQVINNTFIPLAGSAHVYLDAASFGNKFILNNFTTTSGDYITDLNGTNYYNGTFAGLNQGNIWPNVLNGSVAITGTVESSISGLYIGTTGAGYPYNYTNSQNKFNCNFAGCGDYAPLTSSLSDIFPIVGLVNPSNGDVSISSPVRFLVNLSDDEEVINATLYTNESGSWAARETRWNGEINWNDTGLIALWHFNNESGENSTRIYDWSGRGHNGTTYSSPTLSSGVFDTALNFTSLNGVLVPDHQEFNLNNGFTLIAWVNPHANQSIDWARFIDKGYEDSWSFATGGGTGADVSLYINNTAVADSAEVLVVGEWQFVAATYNLTNGTIYRNGVIIDSGAYSTPIPNNTHDVEIGSRAGSGGGNFNGSIDEAAVWNRSMTPAEIMALYNYTRSRFYPVFQNRTYSTGQNITWNVLAVDNVSQSSWATINYTFRIPSLQCGVLGVANTIYNMDGSISTSGSSCFNITAANVTLNCNGYSITGNNATNTYGVYTTVFNTTVKNCVISNFMHGVYYNGADNGTIINTNSYSTYDTGNGIYLYNGAQYNRIINSIGNSTSRNGIAAITNSNYNTIINSTGVTASAYSGIRIDSSSNNYLNNCTGISTSGAGIFLVTDANYNTIINSYAQTTTGNGAFDLYTRAMYNNITNCIGVAGTNAAALYLNLNTSNTIVTNFTGISETGEGIYVYRNSNITIINSTARGRTGILLENLTGAIISGNLMSSNSTRSALRLMFADNVLVANNTMNGSGTGVEAIEFWAGTYNTNNTFINNTLYSSTDIIYISSGSWNNSFILNNFTATSGLYVNDTNGTNYYNGTFAGLNQGNIWPNVINGSVVITGTVNSSISGHLIGSGGAGYPYNYTNSQNKFSCNFANCGDYAPLIISYTDSFPNVSLIIPTNGNLTVTSPVLFISNATDNQEIMNATLYTNESGSWAARETRWNGEVAYNSSGLILLYHFNNESAFGENSTKVYDWSGHGNNATASATAPVYNASGKFGATYDFVSSAALDRYLYVADNNYFSNWSAVTVMAWVRPLRNQSAIGDSGDIISKRGNGTITWNMFYIRIGATNGVEFLVSNETISSDTASGASNTVLAGQWTHIAARYNGTTLDTFVNGIEDTVLDYPFNGIVHDTAEDFYISFEGSGYNGSIDEVAIWNRSLSNAEVAALYNYTRSRFYPVFQNRTYSSGQNIIWNVLAIDNLSQSSWGASNYSFTIPTSIQCSNLTSANTVYTLTSNVSINGATCFNIQAANITLNCNGFSMIGNNVSDTYGVYSNVFNTTIRNCVISNFSTGIFYNVGSDNGLINNVIASTTHGAEHSHGIRVDGNSNIINNSYGEGLGSPGEASGIFFYNGNNNIVTNSVAKSTYYALRVRHGNNNNLNNCTAISIAGTAVSVDGTSIGNIFTKLSVNSTAGSGVYLQETSPNTTIDCQGASITGDNSASTYGVFSSQYNTTIKNCHIERFNRGIYIDSTADGLIYNNTINTSYSGGSGISLQTVNRYNLTRNTIYVYDGTGIYPYATNNLTVDCQGMYIVGGNNPSSTYGSLVGGGSFNTTFRNCNIYNFSYGIYSYADSTYTNLYDSVLYSHTGIGLRIHPTNYSTANNVTVRANLTAIQITTSLGVSLSNINTTSIYGNALTVSSDNGTYINISTSSQSTSGSGIGVGGNYNYFNNVNIVSSSADNPSIGITGSGSGNSFSKVSITNTGTAAGISITGGQNNSIDCQGGIIYGSNQSGPEGAYLTAYNVSISNCVFKDWLNAISLTGSSNGRYVNNTIISNIDTSHIYVTAAASGNTFILNNFTTTSGLYVNDLNGSNYYNGTFAGLNQGNIYANVINGSVAITGGAASSISGLYIGVSGAGYPYNYTNSQNKFSCNFASCADYRPLTTNQGLQCSNLTSANTVYTLTSNVSITGATCFDVQAVNITLNCNGYSITGNNTESTYGVYSEQWANTTVKNCYIIGFQWGIFFNNGATDGRVNNNTFNITYNGGVGVGTNSVARGNNISGNTFYMSNGTAIVFYGTDNIIDCQGRPMIGGNTSRAILSDGSNSSISNCNISNFYDGLYLYSGATGYNISNTIISSKSGTGLFLDDIYNFNINNVTILSEGAGVRLTAANNSRLSNMIITANTGMGLWLYSSYNHTLSNITFNMPDTAQESIVIDTGAFSNTFNNITINTTSANRPAIYWINSGSNNNIFNGLSITSTNYTAMSLSGGANNTIDCQGGSIIGDNTTNSDGIYYSQYNLTVKNCIFRDWDYSIRLIGADNGLILNNTFVPKSGSVNVYLDADASGNKFILNNFTVTSGNYVTDLNGTNYYNGTFAGLNQGNIWPNVLNGSVVVSGSTASSKSGLYVGTTGVGYPYNYTNSQNKFSCNFASCADYRPLTTQTTLQCSNLTFANTIYTLESNVSIDGDTCFTVTAANVTLDCNGYSITGNNTAATYGVYSNQDYTTVKNCYINNFSTGVYYYTGADYGLIMNTIAITTQAYSLADGEGAGILIFQTLNTTIINTTGNATVGRGIMFGCCYGAQPYYARVYNSTGISDSGIGLAVEDSQNNYFNNVRGISNSGRGIRMSYDDNSIFINSFANSSSDSGLSISIVSNITIIGTTISGASASSGALLFYNADNSIVANSTIYAGSNSFGIVFDSSGNNQIINTSITNSSSAMNSGISIGDSNNTIDCQGKSITGTNTTATYGIYSDQFNTTIRNCQISNFQHGIYFVGATNGTIDSTNASTTFSTGSGIHLASNSNYNTISNSAGTSTAFPGIYLLSSSNYNTISNSIGTSNSESGIHIAASSYNIISNSTATSNTYNGLIFYTGSSYNTVSGSQISGNNDALGALSVYANSLNNTIANNTINGKGAARAATIQYNTNTGNRFINNTILNATTLLYIESACMANTFILNNFTATTGLYVNDTNGTNYYNGTFNGLNQGNIWANVINGSVSVDGIVASSKSGLYLGTQGAGYPYNYTNSQNKFSCNFASCADYAPLTNQSILQCGRLNISNTIYTLTTNVSVNGSTCFNVTAANVTLNCNGYSINGNNTASTYGVYSNQYNTTIADCNIRNFASAITYIGCTFCNVQNTTGNSTSSNTPTFDARLNSNDLRIIGSNFYSSAYIACYIEQSKRGVINRTSCIQTGSGTGLRFESGAPAAYSRSGSDFIVDNSTMLGGSPYYLGQYSYNITAKNINATVGNASSTFGAVLLVVSCVNNTVRDSILTGIGTANAIQFFSTYSYSNNTFINNTLSAAVDIIYVNPSAGRNTFCLNNFTATTGRYVNDTNGTNYYNCTIDGKNQGNIYPNVLNGSVMISGTVNSSKSGLYIGTRGSGYPYNITTSSNKFYCNFAGCADYAPLTNSENYVPTIISSIILPDPAYTNASLRGYCNATDADDITLYYHYQWFLNGVANASGTVGPFTQSVSTNVANISSSLLAVSQNWTLRCIADDSTANSTALNSSITTIQARTPEKVTLSKPTNMNYTVHERRPVFEWYATNHTTYYTINITSSTGCGGNYYQNVTAPTVTFTPPNDLCVDTEGPNTHYDWNVKACSPDTCGSVSDTWNFSIEPYVVITLTTSTINFTSLILGETRNTSSGTPAPFTLQNDGNVQADLINASSDRSLWTSVGLGTIYYQMKARQSNESNSFNATGSITSWTNVGSSNVSLVSQLNYSDASDSTYVDIQITVPGDEPPGSKQSSMIFGWEQSP